MCATCSAHRILLDFITITISDEDYTRVYPKVSGVAPWSENCKRYSYRLSPETFDYTLIYNEVFQRDCTAHCTKRIRKNTKYRYVFSFNNFSMLNI
jgi:hypothetical protein